jgi:hypothetical protein
VFGGFERAAESGMPIVDRDDVGVRQICDSPFSGAAFRYQTGFKDPFFVGKGVDFELEPQSFEEFGYEVIDGLIGAAADGIELDELSGQFVDSGSVDPRCVHGDDDNPFRFCLLE